jgi:hypothetical protein
MKKFFLLITILVMASSSVFAADYWHFGVGVRITGVMPRSVSLPNGAKNDKYANALGEGIILTFGNPDSRFTTQFELDNWSMNYKKSNYVVNYFANDTSTTTSAKQGKQEYSGLGVGIFEKYRFLDLSPRFSNYIIGGFGGYFLNLKRELTLDPLPGTEIRSQGFHSLMMTAGGLGFEGRFNDHISSFIEGRYVLIISGDKGDTDLIQGYLGVRYVF